MSKRKTLSFVIVFALVVSLMPLLSFSSQPAVSAEEGTTQGASIVASITGPPIKFVDTTSCISLDFSMFRVEFYKDTAGYNTIYDRDGNVIVQDERVVLQYLFKAPANWHQRGTVTGISWTKVNDYHYEITRHYSDVSTGTTYDIEYTVKSDSPMKITVILNSGKTDSYRLAWNLSGIAKGAYSLEEDILKFGAEGESEYLAFDWSDVWQDFGDITSTDLTAWAANKKVDIHFDVGTVSAGGTLILDPSVVGTSTSGVATMYIHQRKTFYANGRFWVWYNGGELYIFAYRSSTDGINWSDAMSVGTCESYNGSVWFDGTYVHYIRLGGEQMLRYRRGTPNSDGTITWSAEEQIVHDGEFDNYYQYSSLTVDSGGYAWIGSQFKDPDSKQYPRVLKNANNNGTWSTDTGFPYMLTTEYGQWSASVVPLTDSKVYVIYARDRSFAHGKLWDGSSWGEDETSIMSDLERGYYHSAVAEGDDVHLVFLHDTLETGILYNKRTYGTGWGTETTVQANAANEYMAPALSIDTVTNDLYCFWAGAPTANHVYYKKNVGGTWDADPTDWIDETSDTLYRNDVPTCFYQTYNGKIGLLYTTKTVSPFDVKFDYLYLGAAPNTPTNLQPSARQISTPVTISADVTHSGEDNMTVYFYDNSDDSQIDNVQADSGTTAQVSWTGLSRGDTCTFYVKSWDGELWSPKSSTQSFTVNSLPTTPTGWTDLGINLVDHTPAIAWTKGTDADEDLVTTYVYVGTTVTPTTVETSTTGSSANLGSTVTLSDGMTYWYRLRSWDGHEYSDYTTADEFKMNTPPTTTNLKTEDDFDPTRITTTTPTFSWTYSDPDEDTQSHWQIWVGTELGTSDMWLSGELSGADTSDVYDGSALSRGETYYVQVQTKDTYEWSTWRTGTFQINQLPTQTYSEQSFYMGPPYTPTLKWYFSDPDGDTQLGVKIRVDNDSNFESLLWDYSDDTTTVQTKVYAGGTLERGVTYYARVQVRDSSTEWSGTWSDNTFTIIPVPSLVVTEITVDSTPVDRKAHWAGDDDIRLFVTIVDNEGRDDIKYAYLWIRDNGDTVVVDNVSFTAYDNVDPNTKKFWYDYNPSDILLDSALGEFDVKVQAVSTYYENTKDYTELGFNLFSVDDHTITFTPARGIYAEGEIITFEPVVKSVITGLGIDNAYLKIELISELEEVLRTVSGYTNVSGKLSAHTTLLEADVGFYDVKISTSKGAIDGQKVYEDVFSVVAEIPVSVESITPSDNYVSGLLRSRSIVAEDVVVKVFVYDTSGTELLSLTSGTIRVENIAPQLKDWEVPYGLTLAEGTYSYRVEVWKDDLSSLYHVAFAEVKLTVAPSQQAVGDWVFAESTEIDEGMFDVALGRESVVTNPTTVNKSNFLFREFVPAPTGSTVMVTVGGLPTISLTVDKYGTITRYFDVPANTTVRVRMEVTIASAIKIEALGETEVVAAVPRTVKAYKYKVTNLSGTILRDLELTFPINEVISVVDEDGNPIEKFWETGSTTVEMAVLKPYGEITLTLTSELAPSLDRAFQQLVSWTIFGIPIIAYLLGAGFLLWLLTKHTAGLAAQVIFLVLPTGLVVVGILAGWL